MIECNTPDLTPDAVAADLEERLPRPADDLSGPEPDDDRDPREGKNSRRD